MNSPRQQWPADRADASWVRLITLLGVFVLGIALAGCGSSSVSSTVQRQPSPEAPGPDSTANLIAAKICPAASGSGVSSSIPSLAGGVYFVQSASEARKLSGVPVITPAKLPAGLVIQGFEIPPGGGSGSSTATSLPIVTIDIARDCDPRSPTLLQLEESTAKLPARLTQGGPDAGTATKLTLGDKQVTWTTTNQSDGYAWQGKSITLSLIVITKGAVPLPEVEAMIVAMPNA